MQVSEEKVTEKWGINTHDYVTFCYCIEIENIQY